MSARSGEGDEEEVGFDLGYRSPHSQDLKAQQAVPGSASACDDDNDRWWTASRERLLGTRVQVEPVEVVE